MATWPANGDTDWNTKMLAYLAVGHDTSGNHNEAGLSRQVVNITKSTTVACTTVLPCDDTLPAVAEGDEVFTLAITPKSATNKLLIHVVVQYQSATNALAVGMALFDNANTCIAAAIGGESDRKSYGTLVINHYMTSGAATEITFKVRVGPSAAGTINVNDSTFGGVSSSSMTITEIQV